MSKGRLKIKHITPFTFMDILVLSEEKKEEIWLSHMTKAHTPTEMS